MDQTTVTVVGMIAAFLTASVTAFLAEPVKLYFQSRSSRKQLRIALYKELLHNYSLLDKMLKYSDDDLGISGDTMTILGEFNLRTECYRQALSNELHLFYQLNEAPEFNEVYSILALAFRLPEMKDREPEGTSLGEGGGSRLIARASREFIDSTARCFYTGTFDKQVLESLVSGKRYSKIMARGREVTEKILHPAG